MKNNMMKLLALALTAVLLLAILAGCSKTEDTPQNGTQNSAQNHNGQSSNGKNDSEGSNAGTPDGPAPESDFEVSPADHGMISSYKGNASVVVIPETINGTAIEKIGQFAFHENETVTKIVFPDTVTRIKGQAIIYCPKLEEIDFGKGLKEIDFGAISYCPAIRSLRFPEGMEHIGQSALFALDNLEELYIPASVKRFDGFINEPKLTIVTPEGSMAAIIAAENGVPVRTPEGKEIVFDPIPVLERAYSIDDLGDGTCMIYKVTTNSTVIEIPETINGLTVVKIGDCGEDTHYHNIFFGGAPNVERIVLPDTVHTVGDLAFGYCHAKEIELGSGLKRVGKEAFFHANVEVIRFPDGTESLNCPFQFTDGIREVYVPASVTEIVKDIAENCEGLTVTVPAGSYAEEFIKSQSYIDYEYVVEP